MGISNSLPDLISEQTYKFYRPVGNEDSQGAIRLMRATVRSIVYSHRHTTPGGEQELNWTGKEQGDVTSGKWGSGQRKDAQNQHGEVCFQDNHESDVATLCKSKLD